MKGTGFSAQAAPVQDNEAPVRARGSGHRRLAGPRDRGLVRSGLRLTQLEVVLPGSATLELSARRAGKAILVAKGARRYTAAGKAASVAKPTKRGSALLRGAKKLKMTVTLRFRSTTGKVTAVKSSLRLKRLTRRASFATCSASPARNRPSASPRPRSACSPSA